MLRATPSNGCPVAVRKLSIASERRTSSAGFTCPGRYHATTMTPRACSPSTGVRAVRAHDVGGRAIVRGLDPDSLHAARRDAGRRSFGRREQRAVVDVDPRPEAAEHRGVRPRSRRRGGGRRGDGDGEADDDERDAHAETVRPTCEGGVNVGIEG